MHGILLVLLVLSSVREKMKWTTKTVRKSTEKCQKTPEDRDKLSEKQAIHGP